MRITLSRVVGGLALVCMIAVASAGLAAEKIPLKLVLNRNTSNLVPFLAADQNLYAKYGLDANILVVGTGAESNELLAGGRAEGATLGLGTTVIAWANGTPLVPIVKYRDGADVYSIIARKGSGITRIEDLKGKRVGVTKGTDPETAFILALKAHHVAITDVQVRDVKWADQAALLERGDIDAANANEPFGTIMVKTMSDKLVLIERLTPYYGDGGLMLLTKAVVEKHPKAAEGIALAFWEGHKIIREHPEVAIASLKKWLKLDDETAQDTLRLFGARPLMTETTVKDLETNADILMAGDKIRSRPDVKKLMDPGFAIQERLLKNPEYKKLAGN